MGNTGTVLLVLWAAVYITAGLVDIDSPGGHEGDEINVYCHIRNFEGVSVFFRLVDGTNDTLSPSSKYVVYRCNKTSSGVRGEDSVLIITGASESDSGTYGCALGVNGITNWGVSQLTDVTVKPASSGADHTYPLSLTTHPNQLEQGLNKHSTQRAENEQSSENTGLIAAVICLSLVVLTLSIALAVMSWKLRNHSYGPPGGQGAGEANGNVTQLSEFPCTPYKDSFIQRDDTVVQI